MTEPTAVAASKDAVTVAYVHDGSEVAYSWHTSLLKLLMWDSHHHQRVVRGGFVTIRAATDGVTQARNRVVRDFLASSKGDWLFWIDTDMGFAPDTVERLLEAADPVDRPVVGALCFAYREEAQDGYGGYRPAVWPVLMDWSDQPGNTGFLPRPNYERDVLTQAVGTGSACILIHRSVFERLREKHDDPTWSRWYSRLPSPNDPGEDLAEDLSFCLRMREAGIPLHVHTGVKTTHMKPVWLNEDNYQAALTAATDAATKPKPAHPELPVAVDLEASLKTITGRQHIRQDGMLKLAEDLDRYRRIIEATKPEVIVETGTWRGESARWFLSHPGVREVISIDSHGDQEPVTVNETGTLRFLLGNSADPALAAKVAGLVAGRRCMVVLDSDHSAAHVAKEIELYGPLVTPGCYLVVEDSIFGYAPDALRHKHLPGQSGTPLDAISEHLHGKPDWSRDLAVERLSPVTHHPAGFFLKVLADA